MTAHQTGVLAAIGMACLLTVLYFWPTYVAGLLLYSLLAACLIMIIFVTYIWAKEAAETRHRRRKWK
jgi:fatty acid desaturase